MRRSERVGSRGIRKGMLSLLLGFSFVLNGGAQGPVPDQFWSSSVVQTSPTFIRTIGNDPLSPEVAFTNSTAILIPASQNSIAGVSSPYPSVINVPTAGTITSVSVTLNGFHHTQQADIDALLVGPTGLKFVFMSDAGRANGAGPIDLTFADSAATLAPTPPDPAITVTGSFKPSNYILPGADAAWTAPAPAAPYNDAAPTGSATFASVFAGTNQQGNWSLYIMDDAGGDFGACNGGWTLNITTSVAAEGTTTTVNSSLNPSLTTNSVTFTAHVVKTSDSTNVTAGSVTFVDNSTSTVLASNVALNGSGNASTGAISGLTERRHLITATYNPDPAFITSNGTMFQTVDFATTSPGIGTYCNTNSISVPESPATSGTAVQFPSHITVSGFPPYPVGTVKVTLFNVTHSAAQDMDMLLVAPSGQTLNIVSDSGGATSNVTLVVDDNAASQIAAGGAWGTTGTTVSTKPVDRTAGDTFPAPAPGAFNSPAPVGAATMASAFAGATANGAWSLYVNDDAGGDTGTFAGGWCLNITVPSVATVPVSGRVLDLNGRGIGKAQIMITDGNGTSRTALTNPFGYYRFDDIAAGASYVVSISSKQYQFTPRAVNINDAVDDMNFTPDK